MISEVFCKKKYVIVYTSINVITNCLEGDSNLKANTVIVAKILCFYGDILLPRELISIQCPTAGQNL